MYHFSWLELIPGLKHTLEGVSVGGFTIGHDANAVMGSWFVCLLLLGLAFLGRSGLNAATARAGSDAYLADSQLNLRTAFELLTEGLDNLLASIMGNHDARRWFWLLGGLFVYILTCNIMGLLPGMLPPTDNINTNVAMALFVLVVFHGVGIVTHGPVAYMKHFLGPMLALAPIILPVELIALILVRPMSLTLRLTGNIFGDHSVFGIFSDLLYPYVPLTWIFLALGLLVSMIQALVFMLLSSVYISLAAAHDEH